MKTEENHEILFSNQIVKHESFNRNDRHKMEIENIEQFQIYSH